MTGFGSLSRCSLHHNNKSMTNPLKGSRGQSRARRWGTRDISRHSLCLSPTSEQTRLIDSTCQFATSMRSCIITIIISPHVQDIIEPNFLDYVYLLSSLLFATSVLPKFLTPPCLSVSPALFSEYISGLQWICTRNQDFALFIYDIYAFTPCMEPFYYD